MNPVFTITPVSVWLRKNKPELGQESIQENTECKLFLQKVPYEFYVHYRTCFSLAATRCTLAHLMFRCMPTTIARTRPSSRKAFRDFEPLKIVGQQRVAFMDRGQLIFTVADQTATSPSRTKLIWVSICAVYV